MLLIRLYWYCKRLYYCESLRQWKLSKILSVLFIRIQKQSIKHCDQFLIPSSTLRNLAYRMVSFSWPSSMYRSAMTEKNRTTARMMETQMNDCLRLTVDKGVTSFAEEVNEGRTVFTTCSGDSIRTFCSRACLKEVGSSSVAETGEETKSKFRIFKFVNYWVRKWIARLREVRVSCSWTSFW